MAISKDLFLAILSMDAYNRGYGEGISGLGGKGTKIGSTTIGDDANDAEGVAEAAGFYAVSYDTPDGIVISYRGTDGPGGKWADFQVITHIAGIPEQARLAAQFYHSVKAASGNVLPSARRAA